MLQTRAWATRAAQALPPLLAALYVGGTQIPGASPWPWRPAMIDLEVYQRTGLLVLSGGDFFAAEGLPWVYPPFAALLTVPFAVMPFGLAAVVWLALSATALAAILFRLGFTEWRLSLVTTAVILLVQPVRDTLGFGQLGILLVAAAVLDSMPGPRVLKRRYLPEGWLVGLATAVKLTPAIIAAQNFLAGRRRPGLVAFATFLVATGIGFLALWPASVYYWTKLAAGDSGLNMSIAYASNQSVLAMWTRLTGSPSGVGLALSGLVIGLGLWAGTRMHRRGEIALGLCLAGLAGLLGSPISWSHHYVWLVPLGLVLLQRTALPGYLRIAGLTVVVWGSVAPFMWLPRGDNVEFTYPAWMQVVDNFQVVAGVAFLVAAAVAAARPWGKAHLGE